MKKILIILMALANLAFGQITLEHSYPGASCYYPTGAGGSNNIFNELYVVRLEVDGDKYVHIDRNNKQLVFYNLNHTPFKAISYAAAVPVNSLTTIKSILYISQKLFDTDNEIEFMYIDGYALSQATTQIINEDGSVIFTANNEAPIVFINAPQQQVSIYNTTAGTKMILSAIDGVGNAQVYSLGGTLSSSIVKNIGNETQETNLYPNPSNNKITVVQSTNPINKITIVDLSGKIVKAVSTNNVNTVELDVSALSLGEYIVQIYDKEGVLIGSNKIIRD